MIINIEPVKRYILLLISLVFWNILSAQNPELISVNPDDATIPEALTVTISGSNTNFTMGTGTMVWFNQGSSAIFPSSVNELNSTLIQADFLFTNSHIPGLYDVHTNNNYDGHLILQNGFTLYPNQNPPQLYSIEPASANAGEIITVSITAENTHFTQGLNYAYLYHNGTYLMDNQITVVSDEIILVEFPITSGSPTGYYDLTVKSTWDGIMTLNSAFVVYFDPNPPVLIDIVPDIGTIPETLTVTISGEGTHFNQATGTIVKLQQASSTIYSYNVIELNEEELLAQFTFDDYDNPGYYDVNTYNAVDGSLYLYNAFYLNPNPYPPQLIAIEPDSAQQGDNLEVSISGQSTNFTQGTGTTVWLNMGYNFIYPYSTTVINDELVNASFYIDNNEITGSYDVNTHNWANGNLVLPDGFTIYNEIPSLTYINPTSAYLGDWIAISIYGENTHFLDADDCTAWFLKGNQIIYPEAITTLSNDELVADIIIPEDAEAGLWSVYATNSEDGVIYLNNAFEVIDTITSTRNNEIFKMLEVFPNPSTGKIFISYELNGSEDIILQLYDFNGNTLYQELLNDPVKNHKELMIPSITAGIYCLKFETESGVVIKKIIIK